MMLVALGLGVPDRKPNIPIDVMNINTITANVRYAFIVLVQVHCASYYTTMRRATSLPTSNALPIAIIGTTALRIK